MIMDRGGYPPEEKYLFLGNLVNKGKYDIEVLCLVLAFKCLYPDNIFLIRGNHESETMTRMYGFYESCNISIYN